MVTLRIVIIADVVASRRAPDRQLLQSNLAQAIEVVNKRNNFLLSPYTLTLGDELQAVRRRAGGMYHDLLTLMAAIYPQQLRCAVAVGEIATAINPHQAIGMDGMAFHWARTAIDELKAAGGLLALAGIDAPWGELAGHALDLVSGEILGWKHSRLQVLDHLLAGESVAQIARQLGLADKSIYKSIDAGRLRRMIRTFASIEQLIDDYIVAAHQGNPSSP